MQQPVDCTLGQNCYIQNYVDRDPSPGARDAGCGHLTYDGHKGTDFALPTIGAMQAGVDVLAAAPGTVKAIRDGEPDRAFVNGASVAGKECGNGILVEMGDGWETQYCHLRKGSVAVKPGDHVTAGETLGLVGQSGKAEFPHLHIGLRHDGKVIDPFDPDMTQTCAHDITRDELWSKPLAYVPSGLLQVGLADTPPSYAAIKSGIIPATTLPGDGPALVAWVYGFGMQAQDVVSLKINGPDGFHFAHDSQIAKPKALFFEFAGKKTPPGGWPAGEYRAQIALIRDGKVVNSGESHIKIN
ncbi:M23 family metallopeptidase [Thioclava indica]|uniref:M23 family metallopeptidase n=1 Tax=Thioclava indica TaxID=1353528 RepID=UPI00138E1B55|nr:M23 family metallopeptidase [Thioclava indica]